MAGARRLTLADLKRAAGRFGGTVSDGEFGRDALYQVDAPAGKVWEASGLHYFPIRWWLDEHGRRPQWAEEQQQALASAIEEVNEGVAACDDPACDICHPEEE